MACQADYTEDELKLIKEERPILIELCKSHHKGKWNMRIGDIKGCVNASNFSFSEIIELIKDEMWGEK
jgi:hypothetical protein